MKQVTLRQSQYSDMEMIADLRAIVLRSDLTRKQVILNVLQGSSAKQNYKKFGFNVDRDDAIDVYMSLVVEGD